MRLITLSTLLWLPFTVLAQLDEKQPVDGKVNSTYIETRPLISPSGKYLYFSRREHPDNVGGAKDDQDIWRVALDGSSPEPVNLGKDINSKKSDALVSVNNDDSEIVLFNTGKFKDAPLVRIKKQGSGWGKPEEIVIEDFYNLSPYSDFYYSFGEKIIIMALKRGDSRGGQDLFFSRRRGDGTWTIPESLGGAVNSRKDDFAPFLAADGKSLFYCSYGFKGSGQADIYYSYRLDDTWENWSPPVNLGSAINSPNEEIYVSVSADFSTIYFDSYSPKASDRNVYQAQLPEAFKPKPPEPEIEEEVVLAKQEEKEVKESVEEVMAQAKPEVKAEETVAYVPSPDEEPLRPTVAPEKKSKGKEEKPLKYVASVDIPILILEEENREKVSRNIYFASNKASFDPSFRPELEKVIALLSSRPDSMIHLEGHADDRGVREANIKISYERAVTVKRQLVKMGVPEERIELFWKGDTEPLASNDDEKDGRELNRRVEIYFSAN